MRVIERAGKEWVLDLSKTHCKFSVHEVLKQNYCAYLIIYLFEYTCTHMHDRKQLERIHSVLSDVGPGE